MNKIIKYYLPVIAWAGLIFFLSSRSNLPGPGPAVLDFVFKKSAHMFVYAVLYFLTFRAVNLEQKNKNFWLPLVLSLAYAASDEFHQSFVPHRTPAFRDIGFDFIGMSLVMLKIKLWP